MRNPLNSGLDILYLCALLWSVMPTAAQAHLMAEQRGTLNFVGSGAFMVLSVPVTAFAGVDSDGDGKLSMIEFNLHRARLTGAVIARARLLDDSGARPLQGIMLAPSVPGHDPAGSASHIVVIGRFALPDTDVPLSLDIDLFGSDESEQRLSLSITRKATDDKQTLTLTPTMSMSDLFRD